MNTPIADYVRKYAESNFSRFHMPGHKGENFLGIEKYDITEISGADVLSQAEGIIAESENNASKMFNTAKTFFSTGGSTLTIYAMLALVRKEDTLILAARNVHKAFVNACALLDYDVEWIKNRNISSYVECNITQEDVERAILKAPIKPAAVYLTTPDYLGNIQDIPRISGVCRKYDIPLIVDNAHGAYLAFLEKTMHPIHLGATMCCDSAHKTLPVLTGGAYLHIARGASERFSQNARKALSLFSSTSPSYLILQSLDLCNKYLDEKATSEMSVCSMKIKQLKIFIREKGFSVIDGEPFKIVVDATASGYTGCELAEILRKRGGEAEFYDEDYLVLMLSPQNKERDFELLYSLFSQVVPKTGKTRQLLPAVIPKKQLSLRNAVFAESETVDVENSIGRVCASVTVSCPPAVPVVVSGEEITVEVAELLKCYGISKVDVVVNG